MDLQQVAQACYANLNPNNAARLQAEAALNAMESAPGFPSALLQLVTIEQYPFEIRQFAVVRLKNLVSTWWDLSRAKENRISEQDRTIVRDNLLNAIIVQKQAAMRKQLFEIVLAVARVDYPQQWPNFLNGIIENMRSNDVTRTYGALGALYALFKRYERIAPDRRKPTEEIVARTFPLLLPIAQGVVQANAVEAFEMMRVILKIVHTSVSLSIPPYFMDIRNFAPWMHIAVRVLGTEIPAGQVQNRQQALKHPLTHAQKWAAWLGNRSFCRFGRPEYVSEDLVPWATEYFRNFAGMWLETFMKQMLRHKTGLPILSRTVQLALGYLQVAVSHKELFKLMKPHIKFVILDATLPVIGLSQDDLRAIEEDPNEFVRNSLDIMKEFEDPRIAAQNLLIDLLRIRTQASMKLVTSALSEIFVTYQRAAPNEKNFLAKQTAMRTVAVMRQFLVKPKFHKFAFEALTQHVFPECGSPLSWMRATAQATLASYWALPWHTNPAAHEQYVQLVLHGLADREVIVRVEATFGVARLMKRKKNRDRIRPLIPQILDRFFALFKTFGSDRIVANLSAVINHLDADIIPYAVRLAEILIQSFRDLRNADEEDDEAGLASMNALHALNNVVVGSAKSQEVLAQLERVVGPLIVHNITTDSELEFFEPTMDLVTCFTYLPDQISPFMWNVYKQMLEAIMSTHVGPDYMGEMLNPLDNFIKKGDYFLQANNPSPLDMLMSVCKRILEDEKRSVDQQWSCKFFQLVLAHHRFRVDRVVPLMLELVLKRLVRVHAIAHAVEQKLAAGQEHEPSAEEDSSVTIPLIHMLLDTLGFIIYYNPALTLGLLAQTNNLLPTFRLYCEYAAGFERRYFDQKMAVIGLSSVVLLPTEQLPVDFRAFLPNVIGTTLQVLKNIVNDELELARLKEEHPDEAEAFLDDDDGVPDEPDEEDGTGTAEILNKGDDEDAVDEREKDGFTNYAAMIETLRDYRFAADPDNVDPDLPDNPLDLVHPFQYFTTCMQSFAQREPALFAQLPPQLREGVEGAARQAHEREQKRLQREEMRNKLKAAGIDPDADGEVDEEDDDDDEEEDNDYGVFT